MANIVKFHGKLKWVKTKNLDKYGKWGVQLYPDDATRKAIKALGIRLTLKEDDEDGFYYNFNRRGKAKWGDLEAPYVLDENGTPTDEAIANGSEGWVVLDVYEYKAGRDANGNDYDAGKAARWEGLEMTKLIPYVKPIAENLQGDNTTEEGKEVFATKSTGTDAVPF